VQIIAAAEQSEGNVRAVTELERLERLIKNTVARATMLLKLAQLARTSSTWSLELNLSELIKGIVND